MANLSSLPSPIYCVSFNQDNSGFAISWKDSFKIFDSTTGRLCYERAAGAFVIVEMLYSSDLLAIVGAGEQASLSPRRLCLFKTTTGLPLRELNFLTSILAVRMNKKRLVVVLLEKTFVYDLNTLVMLDTIDTVPNPKGLSAFSPSLEGCYLAVPASTTKGSVLVYNVMDLQSHSEIDAHRSPLAAIALSSNGMYIATGSEQGTLIRVHLVSEATKSYSFRRGTYPSTIYSLSFGPSTQLPDILIATSSSGSIHAFSLSLAINQRSKRSTSFLGSVLPDSVSDALDPAHHHVLQNAVSSGIRSYAVVRKIDKLEGTSSPSHFTSLRATVSVITYNGYFQEYTLSINNKNESLWTLEREFNLFSITTG
ncbi:autophagy 18 B-like protein [Arabidopsis thaliana]|jgi:autophagy-related protein 18|uniref:Autophagy-related protein 18b n=2 Tax=Arabidopsis thaliana TaxID=3702 RepID=AT18B_ARATH|nr:autophagy 18 B-like protein [Arabidopsis thaliana]Q8H1Q8.2 RecName: Full=Autophagy-related protein 18b; Short=AtATG18b [Arabidopsis thaliana]AEE85774.2 autophagy 18 B-like protein [Arabidopsis thaliana]|eukprot:NP_001320091.1 autophagy 18 B-like protein [Arabidopsis thaliana]